jgi:hypothetical protein
MRAAVEFASHENGVDWHGCIFSLWEASLKNGVYRVHFRTPFGEGAGVTLVDGILSGGDSGMFYIGSYEAGAGVITANVKTGRHTPGGESVLNIDDATIVLNGTTPSASTAIITGAAKEAPNLLFQASLELISELPPR